MSKKPVSKKRLEDSDTDASASDSDVKPVPKAKPKSASSKDKVKVPDVTLSPVEEFDKTYKPVNHKMFADDGGAPAVCGFLTFANANLSDAMHFGPKFNKYSKMYKDLVTLPGIKEYTLKHSTGFDINMVDLTVYQLLKLENVHNKLEDFVDFAIDHAKHLSPAGLFVVAFAACFALELDPYTSKTGAMVNKLRKLQTESGKKIEDDEGIYLESFRQRADIADDFTTLQSKVRENALIIFDKNIVINYVAYKMNDYGTGAEDYLELADNNIRRSKLYKKYNPDVKCDSSSEDESSDDTKKPITPVDRFIKNWTNNGNDRFKDYVSDDLNITVDDEMSLCILLAFERAKMNSELHFGPKFNQYDYMYQFLTVMSECKDYKLKHSTGIEVSVIDLAICKLLRPENMYQKFQDFLTFAQDHIQYVSEIGLFVLAFAGCYVLKLEPYTPETARTVSILRDIHTKSGKKFRDPDSSKYYCIRSIQWLYNNGYDVEEVIRKNSIIIFHKNIIREYCAEHQSSVDSFDYVDLEDANDKKTKLYKKYDTEAKDNSSDAGSDDGSDVGSDANQGTSKLTLQIAKTLVSIFENCAQAITKNFLA